MYFHVEHRWDEDVSEVLATAGLESTEFDADLGTIGGGNHFAEIQAVENILDAKAFKRTRLGREALILLVHSGSRGVGGSILRAHVEQHFGSGVDVDSFAAEEFLRGHEFAMRWAKTNRELIVRRFAGKLGGEAELLWDGCHNQIVRHETDGETVWIHRQRVVAADNRFVVIPGSRGSLSYLVK